MPPRLSYEQTCQDLFADGLISEVLPLPKRMPHPHDTPWNWSSFKEGWEELDFSNLTLTRTFFMAVRFTHADLSGVDLRHSQFTDCDFSGATLMGTKVTRTQAADLGLTQDQRDQVRWYQSPGPPPAGG